MLRTEESHGEEHQLCLDDFRLFPLLLYLHASESSVLAYKLKGVDVPATDTSFLMAAGCLQGPWEVLPRVVGVDRSFNRFGHDFYLCHTLAALAMSGADAVRACVTTTDDQYVLVFGGDALLL